MLYPEIEDFVDSNTAKAVKEAFTASVHNEREDWKMAVMTLIACGSRKDLEEAFPEYVGANPANHDWSK